MKIVNIIDYDNNYSTVVYGEMSKFSLLSKQPTLMRVMVQTITIEMIWMKLSFEPKARKIASTFGSSRVDSLSQHPKLIGGYLLYLPHLLLL